MEEKNAKQIIDEINKIDNNVTSILVPMLKDTVKDYSKIIFRLIIIIIIMILGMVGTSIYSVYQYKDFLSQFEYDSEEVYTQDLDTGEGGDIINSSINGAD